MSSTVEIVVKGKDQASGTLAKIGSGIAKNLGKAAIAGVVGLGAGVTALGVGLGKLAIDALPLQGISDAFAGISGNTDKMLASLREGSLGMVRDIDLMKSYNLAAQLVGKTFADELPGAMGYLSKVSLATGQDMGFMMDSLVRGVGRLSPLILDNLGISVNLEEAYAAYAESIGKSVDELTKQEQQTAVMNQVMEKLAENTANMPGPSAGQLAWQRLLTMLANLKDKIALSLGPALEKILVPLGKLAEEYGPRLATLFEERILPVIEDLATAFGQLLSGDAAGALETLFGEETATKILDVKDKITGFVSLIEENLTPILAGLGAAILAHVIPAFIAWVPAALAAAAANWALLAPILATIAPILAIGLAVGLLVKAWQRDWGGIRTTLTKVWNDNLKPIFEAVKKWLEENIPRALQFLTDVWNNVLLPAIKAVWGFIRDYIIPLFKALIDVWLALLKKGLEVLSGVWKNVLLPALKDVWKFVKDSLNPVWQALVDIWNNNLKPALEALRDFIVDKLGPKLKWLKDEVLDKLKGAFDGIKNAIQWVIDKLNKLKDAIEKLPKIDLGSFQPGSPTPFELGLRGIGAAMRDLSRYELPRLQAGLQMQVMGGGAPGGSRLMTTPIEYHLHIHSNASTENLAADFAMLRAMAG